MDNNNQNEFTNNDHTDAYEYDNRPYTQGTNFILLDDQPQPSQDQSNDLTVAPPQTFENTASETDAYAHSQPSLPLYDASQDTYKNAYQDAYKKEATNEESTHVYTKKSKRKSGFQQARTPLMLAGCLLVGAIGGFGGSYLANSGLFNDHKAVIYQSVTRTDKDGNSVTNMSVKDVVANTEQSVVEITTESAANDSYFQQMITTGAGSGVIISKDGYIVTNHHVIDGANRITVRTKDGKEYDAQLIGKDSVSDLAVIKVDAAELAPAVFGSSSALSVGDEAIAIGNPLGELGGTVTRGIISALDREITIDGQNMTLLQTDTAINKGNSGGGLFNASGELIGIVNAKSSGTSVEGLGFAIPIDTAKPIIESLIHSGYVTGRPQLGVSMVNVTDELTAFQAGVDELGVYIAKIIEGSAADKAGLQVKDRILFVDDNEITSTTDISNIISEKKVGDTIRITVVRNGKQVHVKATLQEAQNQD